MDKRHLRVIVNDEPEPDNQDLLDRWTLAAVEAVADFLADQLPESMGDFSVEVIVECL